MKKFLPCGIILSAILMLSGCVSNIPATTDPLPTGNPAQAVETVETTLTWVLPATGREGAPQVLEAFNRELKSKLPGVTLEVVYLDEQSYQSDTIEYLENGNYDIIWGDRSFLEGEGAQRFMPLERYLLGQGAALYQTRPEWLWDAARAEGGIYGIPAINDFFTKFDFITPTSNIPSGLNGGDIDALGGRLVTPVEYFTALEGVLANAAQATNGTIAMKPLSAAQVLEWYFDPIAPGVVVKRGEAAPLEPVSYYESPYFKEWALFVRAWYSSGFYPLTPISEPDSWANAKWGAQLFESGVKAEDRPAHAAEYKEIAGAPATVFYAISPAVSTSVCGESINFINAQSPNAIWAVELLTLLNTDESLFNLLALGREGSDYTYSDEGAAFINKKGDTPAYQIQDYVIGNVALSRARSLAFRQNNVIAPLTSASPTGLAGFEFNPEGVEEQVAAVQRVISLFEDRLVYGVMKNVDQTLEAFITALKQAGIDDIMQAAKAQLP